MAGFETHQEYQRIEDYDEDTPPGEEDLLIHVPESRGGTYCFLLFDLFFTLLCVCMSVLLIVFFTLQIHGIISRTLTISSQEYPLVHFHLYDYTFIFHKNHWSIKLPARFCSYSLFIWRINAVFFMRTDSCLFITRLYTIMSRSAFIHKWCTWVFN